jgi:hypothetical protein
LGDATVVHVSPERIAETRGRHRAIQYVQGISLGHVVTPGQIFVLSDWIMEWVVQAPDRESATGLVQGDLAPSALTALNTLTNTPFRLELMRISELDPSGRVIGAIEASFFPPDGSFRFCNPLPKQMSAAAIERANRRLETLRTNEQAVKLGRYFEDAISASHFWSGHTVLAYAPLLGFHLCIESVLQILGGPDSTAEERSAAEEQVVSDLSVLLASSSNQHRARAVREASNRLNEISHGQYQARLNATVGRLGLGEDVRSRLQAFYKFRNDHLGHPNSILEEINVAYWVAEAHELARLVLASYLDMLCGTATSDPISELGTGPEIEPHRHWDNLRFQNLAIFLDPGDD